MQPTINRPPKKAKLPTVTITIRPLLVENVDVSEYLVMLSEQSREKRSSTETTCPQVLAKNCYVAKTIPATEIGSGYKFIAGDGSDGNPSLNFGAIYDVYLAVRVFVEEGYEPLVMVLEPQSVTVRSEQNSTGTIAGAVVGTFALLAIGGTIFLILRYRRHSANHDRKDLKSSTELYCLDERELSPSDEVSAPSRVPSQPIASASNSLPCAAPNPEPRQEPADGEQANDEMLYENPTRSEDRTKTIAVDELEFHIKTNIELIEEQYKVELHQLPAPTMNVALTTENKGKCRYKGLYPSDKYRVCLKRTDLSKSDFINASIMKGYGREAQYIAAQGPFTDAVVEDFWLMIWQQQPSAIVMVTRAIEQTKMKCKQYWPLSKGHVKVFGDFQVELKSSETYSDFSTNQLQVTLNGKSRVIPHFNYLTWPDHGVPDIEVFVSFHRLVTTTISHRSDRPLLVHCSAGVGRSGTYIALDYLIDQAKAEGVVNMFECVKMMRERRPCMIQTVEQYVLLHQALYESLATEKFICQPYDLEAKIQSHLLQDDENKDVISLEFEHAMKRTASHCLSYDTAKLPINQDKSRFSEILPPDSSMPYLKNYSKGNFVNAVLVDGYKEKKQWIATQLPLSITTPDFWQLILELEISAIVQLETSPNAFYPMKDETAIEVEPFLIKRFTSADREGVKVIKVSFEKEGLEDAKNVQVIVLKNWTSETVPTTDMILSLQREVETAQQKVPNGKICVTCLDGSTKCGIFICAYNVIEKLKTEQMVDVYYSTIMAKLRRPQFIPTMEQYIFLYQVLKDYMDAFGEYANFT
ncbi:receptor-type tyrosine-protein phosphatase epsilon-like [Watersipora subatra]|uniref:receptor-type tyrosine-protein phosphatase epsilon-like n=1 Tax=Watersipora subatra TaxID=2589382 RepID=UPI00355BAE85